MFVFRSHRECGHKAHVEYGYCESCIGECVGVIREWFLPAWDNDRLCTDDIPLYKTSENKKIK